MTSYMVIAVLFLSLVAWGWWYGERERDKWTREYAEKENAARAVRENRVRAPYNGTRKLP